MPDLKLIVTIDTEEDDWAEYARMPASLANIERIPELQRLFDEYRVTPTYLVSHPVAESGMASSIFREILSEGRCEVGAHCHPWNTPPFEEKICKANSMLCNLPAELQHRKLKSLTEAIGKNIGIAPVCFRAGRWGFDGRVAENISRLGYRVDSSVTPYVDWSEYHGPDHSRHTPAPFRFLAGQKTGTTESALLEVPPSVGFLQKDFTRAGWADRLLRRKPFSITRLIGILDRLKILNKVWLSPELSTVADMVRLTKVFMAQGAPLINMTFHSPSLVGGLTPFVPSKGEEMRFLGAIKEYLGFVKNEGIESIGLSAAITLGRADEALA